MSMFPYLSLMTCITTWIVFFSLLANYHNHSIKTIQGIEVLCPTKNPILIACPPYIDGRPIKFH